MKRLYNTTMTVILYDDICTFLQFRMTISHRKLQAAVVEHMNVIFSISNTCRFIAINGKHVLQGKQGRGKCTYKGKTYEGEVEYIGNKLYVGGKYVKDM